MENSTSSNFTSARPCRFTHDALAHILTRELALSAEVPLYIAFSGGLDSHVLLHALAALRTQAPWQITALHIDHGLQPDSAAWARHCAAVCAALGVAYRSERVVVNGIAEFGLEDAARRARYAVLARLLPAGAVLLAAHHQDDQAETVLLQLLRGAGVPGLAGMPAITPFARGRLARPLLGFKRAELAAYAAANGLHWIDDASNADTRRSRNFLRQRLLPVLTGHWPEAAASIARVARHQAEAGTLLQELARIDLAHAQNSEGELVVSAVASLSPERQANLLRYWIRTQDVSAPSDTVLRQILARLRQQPLTRHAVVRWRDGEVRRYRDRLAFFIGAAATPPAWEAVWTPTTVLEIPGASLCLRALPAIGAGLSRARLEGKELHVRLRRGGERCRVRGHQHKVKKLLQEAGVPPWERAQLPLIYVDDALVAIGDRWICEPYGAQADEPGLLLVLEKNDARPS